jgi:hypothetical protein
MLGRVVLIQQQRVLFNAGTLTWTAVGATGKSDTLSRKDFASYLTTRSC